MATVALSAVALGGCGDRALLGPADGGVDAGMDAGVDARVEADAATCDDGEMRCEGECVVLSMDPAHCGACGVACTDAMFCVDGDCVDCGGDGVECCEGDACAAGHACDPGGVCRPCGADGEACCEAGACEAGLGCFDGSCAPCGGSAGAACCPGDTCGDGLACDGESCVPCGGAAEACCAGDACDDGFTCGGSSCVPCGGADQPCCAGTCGGALACVSDVCRTCGARGEACCEGESCELALSCTGGICACAGGDTELSCDDLADDDCDLAVDCADTDCDGLSCGTGGRTCASGACSCPTGTSETSCTDGDDDDCDLAIDCADTDCDGMSCGAFGVECAGGACVCPGGASTETACSGGVDDDCDGLTDCMDSDCFGPACGCTPDVPCDTGNACEVGRTSCASGVTTCEPVGPKAPGTVCRGVSGVCDVAETCDGSSLTCPSDGFAVGSVCRGTQGDCDVADTCDGSGVDCPSDTRVTPGTICRSAASGGCDVAEACDGGVDCPADGFVGAGIQCRTATGDCDLPATCSGSSATCPANGFRPATFVCRDAAGDCDLPDRCTGSSAACPGDARQPGSHVCRAQNGDCDVAESCTGGVDCPSDGFRSSSHVCRPDASDCGQPETCTGSSGACPSDVDAPNGTRCGLGDCLSCQGGACTDPEAGLGWVTLANGLSAVGGDTDIATSDITTDHLCRPVVTWQEDNHTHVRRYESGGWTSLGGPLKAYDHPTWDLTYGTQIAQGPGEGDLYLLVLEYIVATDGTNDVVPFVLRWTGSAWEIVGGTNVPSEAMLSFAIDFHVTSAGHPILSWNGHYSGRTQIRMARWTGGAGGAWADYSTPMSAVGGTGVSSDFDLDASDRPHLSWSESSAVRLRRWDGTWLNIDTGALSPGFDPSLAIDSVGRTVVAWHANVSGSGLSQINVQRWNGASWTTLGTALNAGSGEHTYYSEMEIDPSDRPVVVWYEGTPSNIYVRRHQSGSFAPLGTGVLSAVGGATNAQFAELHIDPLGRPIVVWREEDASGVFHLHVRRWHD